MSELTKNINYIFGYVLLYSVIIFTTLSAVFGGVVVYPIYAVICIIKKIRENCRKNEIQSEEEVKVVQTKKKPIIDENWCNVSIKNIINFADEIAVVNSEADASEADASEADASEADASEADASEADDYSPKDKYSIGHYKSKTHIKDPLDFVEY
jgi:hypothetical protein